MLVLYNTAICFCKEARRRIVEERYEDAHALLVKAENIVMELPSGLRRDASPQLVDNLSQLFRFVFYRLFEADLSRNPHRLDEAIHLFARLRNAWTEAVDKAGDQTCRLLSSAAAPSVEPSTTPER